MRKSFWVLLLVGLLDGLALTAQQTGYGVKGMLADSSTLVPEVYVTVRVYKQPEQTKEIAAFVSDDKGAFRSVLPAAGYYRMMITSVGKETMTRDFEITAQHPYKDMGRILLKDDVKQLAEVSVVAAKPLVKAEVDKTSYSIEDDPDSQTYTMLEMLRKVPMVTVDGDDNIRVNGSTSFKVYMNGKPSNMVSNNPKEVLRSIPASTIRKVEVITEPGARYEAEGVSGILNIITKGAEFEGYSGNVGASYMTSNRYRSLYGFLTMQYGKLSLSANYTLGEHQLTSETDYFRHQLNSSAETYMHSQAKTARKVPQHYGSLEASYELDSLNLITLSGSFSLGTDKSAQEGLVRMDDANELPVYSYNRTVYQKEAWGNGSVKADYQHLFKRNKEEMLTLSYQFDYMPNDLDYLSQIFNRTGYSPSLRYLYNYNSQVRKAHKNEHTFQLDYVNPFLSGHTIEGGVKYVGRHNSSYSTSEMKEKEEEPWRPSDIQSELDYNHTQQILSAYSGYTFKRNRIGVNAGLRMEHTWQKVRYKKGDGDAFDYQATDWVPSFSLSYKLNDNDMFKLAYNLRIRRPDISRLNPYRQVDGSGISYGNPHLTSEKHNRITLTYSHLTAKFNMQATALYTLANNGISPYQFIDEQGMFHSTYGNLVSFQGGGISGYVGYMPFVNTTLSVNAMIHYLDLKAEGGSPEVLTDLHSSGFSTSLYADFTQRFKYGWRLVLSGAVMRPEISLGSSSFNYYYYGFSLVKTFLKEKLMLTVRAQDCFTPWMEYTINENNRDYTSVSTSRNMNRAFGITVTYRFGDLKANVKKAARSINNDDLMKKGDAN